MFRETVRTVWLFGAMSAIAATAQPGRSGTDSVRLNEIQVVGTHNSYHAGIAPNEVKLWEQRSPDSLRGLDYRHAPLDRQFAAGVRQIELDVFADSKGGLLADPAGPKLVAQAGLSADVPFDPGGIMKRPGFKVLHVQDIDYRSTCQTLIACLEIVRAWSRANPAHVPLFLLIETKSGKLEERFSSVEPETFSTAVLDALDAEIHSVFPATELITPDDVRGEFATLPEALRKRGWPTLGEARGKVVFLLDQRAAGPAYLNGHPALRGRVLFTNAEPGAPDAAFTEQNDGSAETIRDLVRQGYLVRTRTDADTSEARSNNTRRRDEKLASGAQLLSTDYPSSEPARWTGGYTVSLPGAVAARCNPVLKPAKCMDVELEPSSAGTKNARQGR